jgi:CRISPR-associated exonuclease Cas4
MYTEDELLPVSALQHLVFCERQWGLIHLEQLWAENVLTVQGQIMHERVHGGDIELRGDVVVARGVALRSLRLGLTGKADVVEFIRQARDGLQDCIIIEGRPGLWKPVPVEYKLGKPKLDCSDEIQLCAQALCLEEMLGIKIERGEIYYGRPRRRSMVLFDNPLREATEAAAHRLHELTREGQTPKAVYRKACKSCSLYEYCLPKACGGRKSVEDYIQEALLNLEHEDDAL